MAYKNKPPRGNKIYLGKAPDVWACQAEARSDTDDIRADLGQEGTEVKIALTMSHNTLTRVEEYLK